MKDDFSALDLLSIDGFRLSSLPTDTVKKKKKGKKAKKARKKAEEAALALARKTHPTAPKRRRLASLLPLLGRRIHSHPPAAALRGWPVPLSWPTKAARKPTLSAGNGPESPWGNV